MRDTIAFALRAEFEGTTEVAADDGSTTEVPKFGGGVLAVDNSDFHVRDQLDAGGGTIVLWRDDYQLVGLLGEYPPLKEIPVPDGAAPLSKYDRRSLEDLRQIASLRDIAGAASLSHAAAVAALDAFDAAQRDGDPAAVEAVQEAPREAAPVEPASTGDTSETADTPKGKKGGGR